MRSDSRRGAFEYNNWDRALFRELRAGGVAGGRPRGLAPGARRAPITRM